MSCCTLIILLASLSNVTHKNTISFTEKEIEKVEPLWKDMWATHQFNMPDIVYPTDKTKVSWFMRGYSVRCTRGFADHVSNIKSKWNVSIKNIEQGALVSLDLTLSNLMFSYECYFKVMRLGVSRPIKFKIDNLKIHLLISVKMVKQLCLLKLEDFYLQDNFDVSFAENYRIVQKAQSILLKYLVPIFKEGITKTISRDLWFMIQNSLPSICMKIDTHSSIFKT